MIDIKELKNRLEENSIKFEKFYNFLVTENKKYNLTSITEKEEAYEKHFLDSLAGVTFLPKNATVLDVGTGAGFPSIPLKIIRDDLNVTMLDSVNKKVNFLNLAVELLSLTNIKGVHSRIEDFFPINNINSTESNINDLVKLKTQQNNSKLLQAPIHTTKQNKQNIKTVNAKSFISRDVFDVATSRATAPLNTLLEYLAPFVKLGGYVICYKGSNFQDEINQAKIAEKELGLEFKDMYSYTLPNCQQTRTILIYNKVSAATSNKYPRGKNLPRVKPL